MNINSQSGRGERNKMYLNQLKDQMVQNQKPNKLEEYQHKILEREEINKLNSYNPFGRPGNGAPLDSRSFNKNYNTSNLQEGLEEIGKSFLKQYPILHNIQGNSSKINNNYNFNQATPFISQNNFKNLDFRTGPNEIDGSNKMKNAYNSQQMPNHGFPAGLNPIYENQVSSRGNNFETFHNNFDTTTKNVHIRSNNQINQPENIENQNKEMTIIPQNAKEQKQLKVLNYQNQLKLQIEEKKRKTEEDKRKEIALDLLEEEKYKQFLQKKKQQEEDQKIKRKAGMKFPSQEESQEKSNNIQLNNQTNRITIKSPHHIQEKEKFNQETENFNGTKRNLLEQNPDDNELQSLQQIVGLTYENLRQTIKEDANIELSRLKSEVEKQYNEMNQIFHKLRMDVKEVSDMKFDAERELNKIREEIEKKKLTNIMYENKLNFVLEKHAPYNNTSIPINEVHPLFNKQTRRRNLNLDSVSTMVNNQGEFFDVGLLNANTKNYHPNIIENKFSHLANRGQDLIGVSEFVPITNNSHSSEKRNKEFKVDENILNDFGNEKEVSLKSDYPDMFAKLDKIAELNYKINPLVKYKTLNRELSGKLRDNKNSDYSPSQFETYLQNGITSDKTFKLTTKQIPVNYLLKEEFYKIDSSTGKKIEVNSEISNINDEKIFIDESNV